MSCRRNPHTPTAPSTLPAAGPATPTAWLRPATATPLPPAAPVARHTGLTGHAPPWAKTVAVGVLFAGIVAALAAAYYRRKLAAWRARLMAYLTAKKQAEARAQAEVEAAAPPPEPYQPPPGSPEAALLEGDLIVPGKTPQVVHEPPPQSLASQPVDLAAWKQADYGQMGANPPEHPHPTPTPGSAPLCTPPPQFYWEAAPPSTPTPTPTPTPYPPPSLQDIAEGICEAAEAVDPLIPDPATVGGPDMGDIIDQAYLWQQEVPPNNPYFETLVRTPIIVAKKFKDYGAAGTNFVCQQIEHEGPYYDLFPLDQKIQQVRLKWQKMDTKHKIVVVAYAVVALLVVGGMLLPK